jgi:hypothetical protein
MPHGKPDDSAGWITPLRTVYSVSCPIRIYYLLPYLYTTQKDVRTIRHSIYWSPRSRFRKLC